ncbi:MAG: hypothetical protein AAFR21_14910 [Pseudomonadota bacterium]
MKLQEEQSVKFEDIANTLSYHLDDASASASNAIEAVGKAREVLAMFEAVTEETE